ncbi:MAG: hypothetical protein HY319_12020 [Armatimonadetes bacterium]|nr:hypothetical protein [Armatimonadota bacterium]
MKKDSLAVLRLPERTRGELEHFVRQLEDICQRNLLCVALYGSPVKGSCAAGSSELPVLVVVERLESGDMRALLPPMDQARRAALVRPLVLTARELRRSTDVMPLELLEARQHYELLVGEDLLQTIFISDEHLRLACEREAKRLVLRLRQLFLTQSGLRPALAETVSSNYGLFLRLLSLAIELGTMESPSDSEALLSAAERALGLGRDTLLELGRLRSDSTIDRAEVLRLFETFHSAAVRLADYLDRLES